jgi:translation initiation factor 3 subunit L
MRSKYYEPQPHESNNFKLATTISQLVDARMNQAVRDFVFDLHESTRRSLNVAEITVLYDQKLRELTDKYFSSSPWPDTAQIAPECNHDEDFLLIYREMTLRARSMASGSFKFQVTDFLDSWTNYTQLFEFIHRTGEQDLMLTPQWIYDILQEFVYQFQGFCQLRTQSRNEKDCATLLANQSAWTVAAVHKILSGLSASSGVDKPRVAGVPLVRYQFGYLSLVEMARLECLLGDHSSSVAAVASIRLLDRAEFLPSVLTAQVSVFYHVGVSLLMLRRYPDTVVLLSEALLHISRVLRPGAASLRAHIQTLLQKMLDKILALAAVAMALCPGQRVDDQIRELVESKILDKFRRMQTGDVTTFEDVFEGACPKFVSPCVPTEYNFGGSLCQEAVSMQVSVFMHEVRQQASLLRLRSYMRMYSSIDIAKLARFSDASEPEFVAQLIALKHRALQSTLSTSVFLRHLLRVSPLPLLTVMGL